MHVNDLGCATVGSIQPWRFFCIAGGVFAKWGGFDK